MRIAALLAALLAAQEDPYDQSTVPLEADAADPSAAKIVLVAGAKSHGPGDHEYFAGLALLTKMLRQTPGVHPVMVRDGWPANEKVFENARAIVVFSDGGGGHPLLKPGRMDLLQKEIDRGAGFVALHYAVNFPKQAGERILPWLGGYIEGGYSTSLATKWTADYTSLPDHPIARGLEPFSLHDEWYYFCRFAPGVIPILKAVPPDATRQTPASKEHPGREEVTAWAFERAGGGRSFGFTGGHLHKNWGDASIRRLVTNAILWTAKVEVPAGGAKVDLDPADLNRWLDDKRKKLDIYWIDVEGGAATLVVTPEGGSLLMDTGWPGKRDPERILAVARQAGLKRIDHLVTSHWHTDHYGGVEELAKLIPVGAFYDHGFPEGEFKDIDPKLKEAYLRATGGKSVVLRPGDAIPLKGAKVRVLCADALTIGESPGAPQTRPCDAHPALPDDASDNARSVGWILSLGDFDFLNLGDLTWNVEHKLVCPKNLIGTVDVYQASHHGLDISNHPALVRAVEPTVAVINNGAKKGGKAKAFAVLKSAPSIKDIFQVHRNVETTPADNAPAELVANDEAACKGEWIRVSVAPDGKSYTVEVPSKRTRRSYSSK